MMHWSNKRVDPREAVNSVFDYEATMQRLDGDRELFCELVRIFLEDVGALLTRLREAIERRDAHASELAVHTIRGLGLNFGGTQVIAAALAIEERARMGRFDEARQVYPQLEVAVATLTRAMQPWCVP